MDFFASSILMLVGARIAKSKYDSRKDIEIFASHACPAKHLETVKRIVASIDYSPSPYTYIDYHGQLQTTVQFFLRNATRLLKWSIFRHALVRYSRQTILLTDGGTVALDWAFKNVDGSDSSIPLDAPMVILFHGLCGDSQAEYIIHMAWELLQDGYRVAVLVARGCGGLPLTTLHNFTGDSRSVDIHEALFAARSRFPRAKKLFWVGFSLGAAASLKYLSSELYNKSIHNPSHIDFSADEREDGISRGDLFYDDSHDHTKCVIDAALCVSPPWNLINNSTDVFAFWSALLVVPLKIYSLVHRKVLRQHQEKDPEINFFRLMTARNIAHFDQLFYRTYGDGTYTSLHDYYEKSSPIHTALSLHCHTPTLSLSARDDPICGHRDCPTDPHKLGSGLIVIKTPFGGHLAFPEGDVPLSRAFTDRLALQWFAAFR